MKVSPPTGLRVEFDLATMSAMALFVKLSFGRRHGGTEVNR